MGDEELFERAQSLPRAEQHAFLKQHSEDEAQIGRIERLLTANETPDSLLDATAMHALEETVEECILPKSIGDFEILGELGRGGMGVVYEARQKSLKRRVALKVLSSGLGLSSKAILRFRREAEAAGKLHHTNIVPIYTTGEDKGIHFYAMELIDGPSLDHVIKERTHSENITDESLAETASRFCDPKSEQRFAPGGVEMLNATHPPARGRVASNASGEGPSSSSTTSHISTNSGTTYFDEVAAMIADVAEALDHAHEHGVIHRDVKPSNLLLGPDGRLSINDFGLARMLEQPGMTVSGEFVGSPLYMSPEQITAGRVQLDHRTDIYSLGATLYELLTHQPPFPGQTRDQVLSQILHKEPVSTRKINRKIPLDLDTICMKAIDKDPDRRYQTAGKLADDLRKYVNRYAISARREGPAGKTLRYVKRKPMTAAFLSLLLLVLATAGGFFLAWREGERQRRIEEIGQNMLSDLFRGQTTNAQSYIDEAEDSGASDQWLSFHRGLRQLFRQDYEDAKYLFEKVTKESPGDLAATALLAVAEMWSGNEYTYFELMSELDDESARTFEEKFFLGYAHHWGNSKLAWELLSQANDAKPGLQYVVFLRGVAARGHASIDLAELDKKKRFIDLAIADLKRAHPLMQESSLALKELTLAYLHRASIYQRLSEAGSGQRDQYLKVAEDARRQAWSYYDALLKNEQSGDAQYALVMLLSELGGLEQLQQLADDWQLKGIAHPYSAHFLAMRFATLGDHDRADFWLTRSSQERPDHLNVDTFVQIVNPNRKRSLKELATAIHARIDRKLDSGKTQNIATDAIALLLLGDRDRIDALGRDRLDDVIRNGELYQPHRDYFCVSRESRISRQELIKRCEATSAPTASLMHAYFYLGVEAIANRRFEDAEREFELCRQGGEFMFTVYFLSDLLLRHNESWEQWSRDETSQTPMIQESNSQRNLKDHR